LAIPFHSQSGFYPLAVRFVGIPVYSTLLDPDPYTELDLVHFNFQKGKILLSAFMENTHKGEKRRKIEHISVSNSPPWKNCSPFFLLYIKPKTHFFKLLSL
jgi:hypothetical protein